MRIYTVIGGVDGTGKSSLSGVLKSERDDLGYIIDVNKITAENNGNNLLAGKLAVEKIHHFIAEGITFSQETTFSGHMVLHTIKEAKESNYQVHLFYVGLNSVEESLRRIQNRVEKGGHSIPTEDVLRRYNDRFPSLARILPYCDKVKFYDNENQFCNAAEYRNGELIYTSQYHPQWLTEFEHYLTRQKCSGVVNL